MSIQIDEAVLKKACMEMIETIFVCLPNAFKGTIYKVGKPPELNVERITSGVIGDSRQKILWGLPASSGYSPPGKSWLEYRDEPGRPLEAMAWCVERQKSWTTEDPFKDSRSVRLQVENQPEDYQHMEPVLVRKADLQQNMYSSNAYPYNFTGDILWKDSEYIVVAVIKIHFRPHTIRMDSHETRVIKKLSRSLGTELLSYQLRQDSMKAIQDLAKDRLNACNYLADSLRNVITKSGIIFTLIKQEIRHLRQEWEDILIKELNEKDLKKEGLENLTNILMELYFLDGDTRNNMMDSVNKFSKLPLSPERGRKWISMQIEQRWNDIIGNHDIKENIRSEIYRNIENLKKSLNFGRDDHILERYNNMPKNLKNEWVRLIYHSSESFDRNYLDRLIDVLESPELDLPSRERSRKSLIQLKALGETMSQLERNTNFLLRQVLNGNKNMDISVVSNSMSKKHQYQANDSLMEDILYFHPDSAKAGQ